MAQPAPAIDPDAFELHPMSAVLPPSPEPLAFDVADLIDRQAYAACLARRLPPTANHLDAVLAGALALAMTAPAGRG